MKNSTKVMNELLVEPFSDLLNSEKHELQSSRFCDLSITEIHVVEAIGKGPRTMTDVAGQIGVTLGTLTTSINRLVRKEYVIRRRSEDDRRFVEIELSEKGRQAYTMHNNFHQNMVDAMAEKLSDENNEVLITSLKKLNRFFHQQYELIQAKNIGLK